MIWVMELGLGLLLGPLMATALLAEKYMVLLVSSGPVQGQWVRVGACTLQTRLFVVMAPDLLNAPGLGSTPFKREEVWSLFHQCNLSSKMASGAEKWGPNPWGV